MILVFAVKDDKDVKVPLFYASSILNDFDGLCRYLIRNPMIYDILYLGELCLGPVWKKCWCFFNMMFETLWL